MSITVEEMRVIVDKVMNHISERARDTEEVRLIIRPKGVAEAIGENYYQVRNFLKSFAENKKGAVTDIEEHHLVTITFEDDYRLEQSMLKRLEGKYKKQEVIKKMQMDGFVYKCEGYKGCGTEVRFEKGRVPEEYNCPVCKLKTVTKTYRLLHWARDDD